MNKQGTDVTKGIVIIATQSSDEDKNKLNMTLNVNNDINSNGRVRNFFIVESFLRFMSIWKIVFRTRLFRTRLFSLAE